MVKWSDLAILCNKSLSNMVYFCPNGQYLKLFPAREAAIHCNIIFNCTFPPNTPHPQLPDAIIFPASSHENPA